MSAAAELAASSGAFFGRLVDVVLPDGGCAMVLVEGYFDESIGEGEARQADGSIGTIPILCVAGYLIESEQAKLLAKEWQEVLDWKGLPYFHMVDCAHGNGPFANLTKQERIAVVARMIGNIKRRTIKGFAVSVNVAQYELFMPNHPLAGKPYTFCAHSTIGGVINWIEDVNYQGDVAYFFEAGHASQPEANQIMEKIFAVPELRRASRYVAHAFVTKEKSLPVQAADLLAWQFYTDIRRQLRGETRHRKDFQSLIDHPHQVTFVLPDMMVAMAKVWGYDTTRAEALLQSFKGRMPTKT